jgi:hypothetical protein
MASPRLNAFWRIAPGVRFIAFEILTTGVLLFECALRSRTCSFVHATRLVRLAIKFIPFERLSLSTSGGHDKHFKAPGLVVRPPPCASRLALESVALLVTSAVPRPPKTLGNMREFGVRRAQYV